MSKPGAIGLAQSAFLAVVCLGGLWAATAVLDLPWLVQPWRFMWASVAHLWS